MTLGHKSIKGIMLESHLVAGRQAYDPDNLVHGQSITDACLSLDDTIPLLQKLDGAAALN